MAIRHARSMDHRGRELQQVTADSRFWWRASDALPPPQSHAAPAPSAPERQTNPWHLPARKPLELSQAAAAPAKLPLRLEVPKSDRRPLRRSAARRRGGAWFAAVSLAMLGVAGAGTGLLMSGMVEPQKMRAMALNEAQGALLGLGFGIDQVSLTGHRFTSDRDIYEALNLDAARTFAAFDADAALKRIESLAWVETAQITRLFPGALKVEVRERRPAALWAFKSRKFLIDATGRVLGAAAEPHGWKLPHISGEGANNEAALLFTALGRHPEIAQTLDHAERIGERRWSLVLRNGSRLELGADREVEGLEQIAKNSELRAALSGAPQIVDVRTPGRLAMRPLSATRTPPPVERAP